MSDEDEDGDSVDYFCMRVANSVNDLSGLTVAGLTKLSHLKKIEEEVDRLRYYLMMLSTHVKRIDNSLTPQYVRPAEACVIPLRVASDNDDGLYVHSRGRHRVD